MTKAKASRRKASTTRKRLKLTKRGIAILASLGLIVVVIGGAILWKQYDYRFGSAILRDGTIQVHTGTTFDELSQMLIDSGYLKNLRAWNSYARAHEMDSVQAGNYTLRAGSSYRTAQAKFYYGRQTPVRLTFNNIRSMERLAEVVSKYIEADSDEVLRVLTDDEVIRSTGLTKATFPSLFIPNTYEVYWTMTPKEFVERMKKEHDRFWDGDRLDQAEELGFTPEEISTIASIVIEETKFKGEMTQVAGVYINRLRAGIPLQADPTVKFAMGNTSLRRILKRHLAYDSPYNTYKYAGLPPGPICIPPISALDATLAYADEDNKHDYFYFCAKADFSGQHAFARTLSEHNRNARAYTRELNRRGIR